MTNPYKQSVEEASKQRAKRELRQELRQRLLAHGAGDSAGVVSKLTEFLEARPSVRVVAAFSAMPGEVDLRAMLSDSERVWVLPKVRGEVLSLHRIEDAEQDLQIGAYGIPEPKEGLEDVAIGEVDLFLCPGLGFDRKGGRIGRGKGFYDRMLEHAKPDAIKLGVCFEFQLVDEIEMEPHDVRMDEVVFG